MAEVISKSKPRAVGIMNPLELASITVGKKPDFFRQVKGMPLLWKKLFKERACGDYSRLPMVYLLYVTEIKEKLYKFAELYIIIEEDQEEEFLANQKLDRKNTMKEQRKNSYVALKRKSDKDFWEIYNKSIANEVPYLAPRHYDKIEGFIDNLVAEANSRGLIKKYNLEGVYDV